MASDPGAGPCTISCVLHHRLRLWLQCVRARMLLLGGSELLLVARNVARRRRAINAALRTGKETKDVTLVLVMVLQWVPRRTSNLRHQGFRCANGEQQWRRAGSDDEMLWVALAVVAAPTTVDFEQ